MSGRDGGGGGARHRAQHLNITAEGKQARVRLGRAEAPPTHTLLDFPAEEGTRSLRFSRTKSGFAKKTISLHKSEHARVRTQAWRNMLTKINTRKTHRLPQLRRVCEYGCVNVCPFQTFTTFTELGFLTVPQPKCQSGSEESFFRLIPAARSCVTFSLWGLVAASR